eukprot:CAMPEP_0119180166 /NCGR_PEP_ID=MMETSP1315-20130426/56231_1 /TAXON_ID=676789 /ORGANISM="Prasinoderma singularis, Strain RCC927" /LENGTH=65 /DNA_ID=CAMNT_0007174435 /DNA_START=65 /DNA_END=259 /DNA_ORIENTATION=-
MAPSGHNAAATVFCVARPSSESSTPKLLLSNVASSRSSASSSASSPSSGNSRTCRASASALLLAC